MNKIWEIYFSPTGTTEKVVHKIGQSLAEKQKCETMTYSFTLPSARNSFPHIETEDLVIFGCPTYAGRLPNLLLKYLDTIEGNNAAAVAIVTYGNRHFDNSLSELCHILDTHHFHTVGAGAFACEHSFSFTLGQGRPDTKDFAEIEGFAERLYKKLQENPPYAPLRVPGLSAKESFGGYYQPQDRNGTFIDIRKVKPLTSEKCIACKLCSTVCPMGAIDPDDVSRVTGICIKCGACIKKCPVSAKYYDDAGYLYHKTELEELYRRRGENFIYL